MWRVRLPSGKTRLPLPSSVLLFTVQLSFETFCGPHITPLLGNISTRKIQSLREVEYIVCSNTYTATIANYKKTEREREREQERDIHEQLVSPIPPFQSEHVQGLLFPELYASAFDPVSSVRLPRTGHRMRALGLAPPQGRNLDLKERSEWETQTRGPQREETDCLSSHGGLYAQSGFWGLVLKVKR